MPSNGALWRERLTFRDALHCEPRLAEEYAQLKMRLAERFGHDREAYTEGKTSFVRAVVNARQPRSPGEL